MKSLFKIVSLSIVIFYLGCAPGVDQNLKKDFPESFSIIVQNDTDVMRNDEAVFLEIEKLKTEAPDFNPTAFVVFSNGMELASQANDLNADGNPDQIVAVTDFKPKEKKRLSLRYKTSGIKSRDYAKRTQAELSIKTGGKFVDRKYEGGTFQNVQFLRVPFEHTDHSEFIRYEGPGWESDKVGYRFYLDWRNAIDIFGKKIPGMTLQNVGQDGFDSYHEMSDWGMDILKVGESLGIGSVAIWHDDKASRVSQTDSVTCEIVQNGAVQSLIRTIYFGWKVGSGRYQLTSELSIIAGSRITRHSLQIEGNPDNLCTGLVKLPEAALIQPPEGQNDWTYLATYGKQSLADDSLGMAIMFNRNYLIEITEDELSHVVVLEPDNGSLTYYFLAAWEQEPDGIKTKEEFIEYLKEMVQRLNHPLMVQY
ncbi:MAG: hypothetical protein AMS26_10705 [Bacteroides sp. SM23_62]|nr:MAG: hypothetical protein AMS26_10705 [Bacteroides sp. SM23_62]